MTLAFFTPGPMELTIIAVVAVLLFGNRLPKVAKAIGSSVIEFKKGLRGIEDEIEDAGKETGES